MAGKYDDIMYLQRPEPKTRPRMPLADRAAQFAPFAALNGYAESLAEVRRQTRARPELSPDDWDHLNACLHEIKPGCRVIVTFFVPDERKPGGDFQKFIGSVHRVNGTERTIEFCDGDRIPIADLLDIRMLD